MEHLQVVSTIGGPIGGPMTTQSEPNRSPIGAQSEPNRSPIPI